MKCYLTVFEELTWMSRMAEQCTALGLEVILTINGKDWPPLDEWLKTCPYQLIFMDHNAGCYGYFNGKKYEQEEEPFILSDSDLDLTGLPLDVITRLTHALELNTDVVKAALSLRIDDVSKDYVLYDAVMMYESKMRNEERPGDCYLAPTGATFAMYDPSRNIGTEFYRAVRLKEPYTVRHEPWYLDVDDLSDELLHYFSKCNNVVYYGHKLRDHIKARRRET